MSRNALFAFLVLVFVAILVGVYFWSFADRVGTPAATRARPNIEQEVKNPLVRTATQRTEMPVPGAATPSPLPSAPTSVRADDTPAPVPQPEPPRVAAISGPWGRNPFLTPEEIDFLKNPRKYEVEPEPAKVRLSTILTVNGRRTAALNGHYVSVGDYVGTERVIRITEYSLTLERENGKAREVKLHEPIVDVKSRSSRN